jgi:diguanylate cyclase (GGDEF)-like protein
MTRRPRLYFTLFGVLFGWSFPLTAWTFDFVLRALAPSIGSLWQIHQQNLLHWIIDLAPIVLGAAGYLIGRQQGRLAASEMRYRELALHDPLTGLPNRALTVDSLARNLTSAARRGTRIALLFLDLDNFKVVNDSLGHEAGDRLLIDIAQRLRACVPSGTLVARLGGDEFTVLIDHVADVADVEGLARRINDHLREPVHLGGHDLVITSSIGIAIGSSVDRLPHELLRDADVALYEAKRQGKARFALFDPQMHARAEARLELEGSLRHAVERGELRLAYQPIVDLATGRILEVEALARWDHPRRGPIPPNEFIPLAEETGLIVPIGTYVLREACRQAERWRTAGPDGGPLHMSINLSARQFARPSLPGLVADVLAETGADPASICFEITESALMEDVESTTAALRDLKALGVGLAIDDFGTGYASLTYLKRFPVDKVKVDRAFVDGLLGDEEDAAIVAAVVNLAHSLDLRAVAEGVETAEQAARLRELGCDLGQGFYFGVPHPAEDLAGHLRRHAG